MMGSYYYTVPNVCIPKNHLIECTFFKRQTVTIFGWISELGRDWPDSENEIPNTDILKSFCFLHSILFLFI
jgi:hypothetical protein